MPKTISTSRQAAIHAQPSAPPLAAAETGSRVLFRGYEGLRENLGRTITSAVPDANARLGLLADPANPGQFFNVVVGPRSCRISTSTRCRMRQSRRRHGALPAFNSINRSISIFQGRIDANLSPASQFFVRDTIDDADQRLPLDYPQFPGAFVSRNQYVTAELKQATPELAATYRAATAARASARMSRPTRRCRHSCRDASSSATSTSAGCSDSARRAPPICG